MSKIKIAVLTSGGDSPGMNAAIRAVVRYAIISNKIKVFGVLRGYEGLINNEISEINLKSVSDIIHRGGTALYTSRSAEFKTKEGIKKAAKNLKNIEINHLVIIGGNGSLKGAYKLSEEGINCIFIPATIDNDVTCSDYTIGFDTATNTAMQMVDKLRDTAQSHEQCSVVEVMGRKSGDIAIHTGLAVGATAIIVPEVEFNFKKNILERIRQTQKNGNKHFIIIVAEGLKIVPKIAKEINAATGIKTHSTVLGYVQRGGSPTLKDRVIAAEMGCRSVEIITEGLKNRIIAVKNGKIIDLDLKENYNVKRKFSEYLYDKTLKLAV